MWKYFFGGIYLWWSSDPETAHKLARLFLIVFNQSLFVCTTEQEESDRRNHVESVTILVFVAVAVPGPMFGLHGAANYRESNPSECSSLWCCEGIQFSSWIWHAWNSSRIWIQRGLHGIFGDSICTTKGICVGFWIGDVCFPGSPIYGKSPN